MVLCYGWCCVVYVCFFFFQAEDGIRDLVRSRGLGDVYKRQIYALPGTILTTQLPFIVKFQAILWLAGEIDKAKYVRCQGSIRIDALETQLCGKDIALQCAYALTLGCRHTDTQHTVSYTPLTLPTIYSV